MRVLRIIPWYIGYAVARATVFYALGLLALVWLLQSLRFLDFLVNKGLGVGVFLEITSLLIPRLLILILPLATLAAAIAVCRRLQDDYETTALLASGLSPRWGYGPLLGWAACVVALLYGVMLLILPASITAFKNLQYDLRTREGQLLLTEGTFNPLGDDLMVYVRRRLSPNSFEQLLVHDTRNPAAPVTWYAKYGVLQQDILSQTPQLRLEQGVRQEAEPRQTTMLEFASFNLDLTTHLATGVAELRTPEVEERSLGAIWAEAQAPTTNSNRAAALRAEVANRLSWPLLPLPLTMLAVAALLHPARRKQSSLRGVIVAALAGIGCVSLQFLWLTQTQAGAVWAFGAQMMWPAVATLAGRYWWQRAMRP